MAIVKTTPLRGDLGLCMQEWPLVEESETIYLVPLALCRCTGDRHHL